MNDPKQVLVERDGHLARVTINRPERRNAISFAAWRSLAASFTNLAADPEVRVVVLTGAGDRAFCAGNDISEFAAKRSTPEQVEAYDAVVSRAYQVIRGIEKPIIARVRGFAVGGGFELMQLCDLQIASAGARFAMTPARLGLGYKLHDVQLLVDRIGSRAAREMLFTGRLFDAAEAQRMGFVTRVRDPRGSRRGPRRGGRRVRDGNCGQRPAFNSSHQSGDRRSGEAGVGPRSSSLRHPRRRLQPERGLPRRSARLRGAPFPELPRAVRIPRTDSAVRVPAAADFYCTGTASPNAVATLRSRSHCQSWSSVLSPPVRSFMRLSGSVSCRPRSAST